VTDNELFPRSSARHSADYERRLVEFVREADALITDTTYADEEYAGKEGWGHSAVGRVAELAHRAQVRVLYLFHHDPDQGDEEIEHKHAACRRALEECESATECRAPRERDEFTL
jgi:ribonuclease BN (tRNA processing enzyme)